MLKDLKLAREAAGQAGADTALGTHAAEIYDAFDGAGKGGSDFSGIVNFIRERSKA
jgi:3-hydroxyisobutyrate dehydrogenase